MSHEELMRLALEEAGQAAREGEVPVGAVLARQPGPTTCGSSGTTPPPTRSFCASVRQQSFCTPGG